MFLSKKTFPIIFPTSFLHATQVTKGKGEQ